MRQRRVRAVRDNASVECNVAPWGHLSLHAEEVGKARWGARTIAGSDARRAGAKLQAVA